MPTLRSNPRWRALISLLFFAAPTSAAAPPDPLALMKQSDARHRLAEERVVTRMILKETDGSERTRTLEIATTQGKTEDRSRLRFVTPADVKGTTFLSITTEAGDSEQWLYLPAFKKTRRIGAADLAERFAGSELAFEDLRRHRIEDYAYKLLGAEVVGGADCWVIEGTPTAARVVQESSYGKTVAYLRKDVLAPVQIRFFDRAGKPLKVLQAEGLKQVQGEAWRADKLTIVDVQRKHSTTLVIDERQVSGGISEDTFSRTSLDRE